MEYITPQIKEYSSIDNLLKNHNLNHSPAYGTPQLSIDFILGKKSTYIVGEPGIGNSRLIEEIKHKLPENLHHCTASSFNLFLERCF